MTLFLNDLDTGLDKIEKKNLKICVAGVGTVGLPLATFLANPISCVTHIIVIPSFASSTITSKTSEIISGSSADVGSSNNIIFGFVHKDLAIATLCC